MFFRIRSRSFSPVIFFEIPYRFIPSIITRYRPAMLM